MADHVDPTAPEPDAVPNPSSRNATTHGLTARRPLCEEEAERMRQISERWVAKHLPETDPEEALVRSAAFEYVRYLRCVDIEERVMRPSAREALDEWEEKRRHAIRRKAQGLAADPAAVAPTLLESAFGIDWMLRHWRSLLDALDSGQGWRGDELILALRLLGRAPAQPDEDDLDARPLWDAAIIACPHTIDTQAATGIGDDDAADRLWDVVTEQVARLDAMRPIAWEAVEGPQAEAVEAAAMVDISKEGQLRQRYRREALRDMHKCLGMVMRVRVERSKMDARQSRQERSEQGTRPRSSYESRLDARPAPADPIAPEPIAPEPPPIPEPIEPTPADRAESRNEPSPTPEIPAVNRRNPMATNEIRNEPAGTPVDPDRRTGPRTEAHRADPGAPDRAIEAPGPPGFRPARPPR